MPSVYISTHVLFKSIILALLCNIILSPFVAVVAPCTSRGKSYKNVAGTPYVSTFFKTVLQTLVKSKDAGYDVAFYVGYDAGDPIWDTDKARSEIAGLLQKQVDQYYKKSLLEEVREMDLMGNSHLAGLSIKVRAAAPAPPPPASRPPWPRPSAASCRRL